MAASPAWNLTIPFQAFNNAVFFDPPVGWVYGATFIPSPCDIVVSALGWYQDPDNAWVDTHPVAIYDVLTEVQVALVTVSGSDTLTGRWRYHAITPVTLTAGREYIVAGTTGHTDLYTWDDPDWTHNSAIVYTGNRYYHSDTLQFPPMVFHSGSEPPPLSGFNDVTDGYWGPGMLIEATACGLGSIAFSKVTTVDDPAAVFSVTVTPDVGTFTMAGGEMHVVTGLDPDTTYSASEAPADNWEQSAVAVSDGTVEAIVVTSGATTTVEFTNQPVPFTPPTTPERRVIRRLRRSPHQTNTNEWVFIKNFELILQTGVGLTAPQEGDDPKVHLRVSRDGGMTWGPIRIVSAGKLGAYRARAIWWQLGRARDLVFEVSVSDPVAWSIVSAYMDADPGTS